MKILCDRILQDGKCLQNKILKVDSFINHQIDARLMMQIAQEFQHRFAQENISKIITVEVSGIAPAVMSGYLMNVPVVFAKKERPSTMDECFETNIFSFTKQKSYSFVINRNYLHSTDNILFIDDFLAYGNAGLGIIDLCRQAGATIAGMGFVIEKGFQQGRTALQKAGIEHIESLAIVESLENNKINLKQY